MDDAKKGQEVLKAKLSSLSLETDKVSTAFAWLPLSDEESSKLGSFLQALGYEKSADNQIDFDDEEITGKQGYLSSEESTGKNGKPYINYRYLLPDDERLIGLVEEEETPEPASNGESVPAQIPTNALNLVAMMKRGRA